MTMLNRRTMIEGIAILGCGLLGVGDSLRLIFFKNPESVEDFTGPGRYLLVVSLILAVVGAFYLARMRREPVAAAEPEAPEVMRSVVAVVGVLALYIFLINILGYFLASGVFFPLILWVVGMRFNLSTVAIGMSMCVGFYVVFVELFGMTFPHGKIFS